MVEMVREAEHAPFLKLLYLPVRGQVNTLAGDIQRFMDEMGLVEDTHYSLEPIGDKEGGKESLRGHIDINYHIKICLDISHNSFGLKEGFIGGYHLIGDFLRKNKKVIQKNLESFK